MTYSSKERIVRQLRQKRAGPRIIIGFRHALDKLLARIRRLRRDRSIVIHPVVNEMASAILSFAMEGTKVLQHTSG
jgi:hypothetical protein